MTLFTTAAHAQTSFLGIKLGQPITASVPLQCTDSTPPAAQCWMKASPNSYFVSGEGVGLGRGVMINTDDEDRVDYVQTDVPRRDGNAVLRALEQKYGTPQTGHHIADFWWKVGENIVAFSSYGDNFTVMIMTPDSLWGGSTQAETNRLANKF